MSRAESGRHPVIVKRVSRNYSRVLSIWYGPALGHHVPDREVVRGEVEGDFGTSARVEIDAGEIAEHAGWLAGIGREGDVELRNFAAVDCASVFDGCCDGVARFVESVVNWV